MPSRANTGKIPTKFGDVLILKRAGAGSTHIVCLVYKDGEQGCSADYGPVFGRPAAEAKARSLVLLKRRIFLWDQDSGEWEEISN